MTNYRDGSKASKITFFEGSYQWCSAQTDWMYSACSAGASFISQFILTHNSPKKQTKPNQNTKQRNQTSLEDKFSKNVSASQRMVLPHSHGGMSHVWVWHLHALSSNPRWPVLSSLFYHPCSVSSHILASSTRSLAAVDEEEEEEGMDQAQGS